MAKYEQASSVEATVEESYTDPSAAAFGEQRITLTDQERGDLERQLNEIIDAFMGSVSQRHRRYKELEDSFALQPNPTSGGQTAGASRLITELTRTHVTTAHARLAEQILGLTDPWVMVEPVHGIENEDSEMQQEAKERADAYTDFLHALNRDKTNTDLVLDDCIIDSSLIGNGIIREEWQVRKRQRKVRDLDGQWDEKVDDLSGIHLENIHPENFICWPLTVKKVKDGTVVGHRSSLTEVEFRAECAKFGVSKADRDEILKKHKGNVEAMEDRPRASDTKQSQSPIPLIEVYELWCQKLPIPGRQTNDPTVDPPSYVVLLAKDPLKILSCLVHPYNCGRHPYFNFPYWRLSKTWLGDGVGQELVYRQKSSDALQSLMVDHLKVAVHHLRVIRDSSSLADQEKDLYPGKTVFTENPNEDIALLPLGGDELPLIQEAQDRNDLKAMEADQVTAVIQGRGDPTLKSGASPSSLQMLLNESGKKFGKVDRNYREELDELFMFQLELIQQYADPKLFYRMMPERGAQEMTRLKMIQRPDGDLREQWKISVRAPSAETNPEVKQTQLTIFYNLTTQHLQTLLTVAQQVWSQTDPARLERVTEEALVFLHALYKQLKDYARIGPIGVPMPDVDPKPIDETINQLYQQFAQLEQELTQARQQNAQMQMMMQPEGVPGGGPMAGMA